jgi:hypothetical protein
VLGNQLLVAWRPHPNVDVGWPPAVGDGHVALQAIPSNLTPKISASTSVRPNTIEAVLPTHATLLAMLLNMPLPLLERGGGRNALDPRSVSP